ncbi:hypothetical protein CDIK_2123 [Cucumispora dikerogammari]|nr:hypothetical protein CDIK_2123 [Cucumispora dikerogammari]
MITNHTSIYLILRTKHVLKMRVFKFYSPLLDLIKKNSNISFLIKIINYIPLSHEELILKENYKLFLKNETKKKLKTSFRKIEKEVLKEVLKDLIIQVNRTNERHRTGLLKKFKELTSSKKT